MSRVRGRVAGKVVLGALLWLVGGSAAWAVDYGYWGNYVIGSATYLEHWNTECSWSNYWCTDIQVYPDTDPTIVRIHWARCLTGEYLYPNTDRMIIGSLANWPWLVSEGDYLCSIEPPPPPDPCTTEMEWRKDTTSPWGVGAVYVDSNCCVWMAGYMLGGPEKEFKHTWWRPTGATWGTPAECGSIVSAGEPAPSPPIQLPDPAAEHPAPPDSDEECTTVNGHTWCWKKQSRDCGWVDDSFVCFGSPDECAATYDGVVYCNEGLPAPPAPTDPLTREPIPPPITVDTGPEAVGDSWDVWPPGTQTPGGGGTYPVGGGIGGGAGGGQGRDLCADHPDVLACQENQPIQKNCGLIDGTGFQFSCQGDPIMCATAEDQFKVFCQEELHREALTLAIQNDQAKLTDLESYDADAEQAAMWDEVEMTDYGVSTWSSTDQMPNASCLAPSNVALFGNQQLSFSFQPFCDLAGMIRGFFIFLGSVAASWMFIRITMYG